MVFGMVGKVGVDIDAVRIASTPGTAIVYNLTVCKHRGVSRA